MAYASSLLAFPFRLVALPFCVRRNLTINDDDNDDNDDMSAYVVASSTSRSALVFTMPTRPCKCNAFLVLSEDIMRNRRGGKYQAEMIGNTEEKEARKRRERGRIRFERTICRHQ
ncbi:hypothetical protein P5V15_001907 [Pogonomyrmex californicus]